MSPKVVEAEVDVLAGTEDHAEGDQAVLGEAVGVEIIEGLVVGIEAAEEAFFVEQPVELRADADAEALVGVAVAPAPLEAVAHAEDEGLVERHGRIDLELEPEPVGTGGLVGIVGLEEARVELQLPDLVEVIADARAHHPGVHVAHGVIDAQVDIIADAPLLVQPQPDGVLIPALEALGMRQDGQKNGGQE